MDTATSAWDSVEGKHEKGPTDDEITKDMGVDPEAKLKEDDPLKGAKAIAQLRRCKEWWREAKSGQRASRLLRLKDHDNYDGDQWDPDDEETLELRGQKAITDNRIKPAIDWTVGTEKRTRIDYSVLPRAQDDTKGAEAKTQLMKYNSDVNRAPFARSRGFKDEVISGLGWLELGVRGDEEDEPTYYRYEDWRSMWYDPLSVEMDLSDARFEIRSKIVDLDIAIAMYPEHAAALKAAAMTAKTYTDYTEVGIDESEITIENEGGDGDNDDATYHTSKRSRIRLVECWYKIPAKKTMIRGGKDLGTLNNTPYDAENGPMADMVEKEYASTYDALLMTVRCMMWAEGMPYPLQDAESPYNHNRFPFVPLWAYRKKRTNEPYGAVRNLISLQDDLNKRRSRALHLLSSERIIADNDATDDWDNFYDEAHRPDGIIRKKRGSSVIFDEHVGLAKEHVMLMEQDAAAIQKVGGVTDENMGRETNATSGRAIQARQDQGHVIGAEVFDNHRFGVQMAGEIELSLIEQFMPDEKTFRITGDRGQQEFMTVNAPDKDGNINDITARKADFVVDTQAYNATLRQAMVESVLDLAGKLPPEVVFNLLDLIVELHDIPESLSKEMVQRIRGMNGQEDPNADPNDPENQARLKAQQEEEDKKKRIADAAQELLLEKEEAIIDKTEAEAQKTIAQIDQVRAETAKTEGEIGDSKDKIQIEKAKTLNQIEVGERQTMKTEKTPKGGK